MNTKEQIALAIKLLQDMQPKQEDNATLAAIKEVDDFDALYDVEVFRALQLTVNELESWPMVRVEIPATMEVRTGHLANLLDYIAVALNRGDKVQIIPQDLNLDA